MWCEETRFVIVILEKMDCKVYYKVLNVSEGRFRLNSWGRKRVLLVVLEFLVIGFGD